MLFWRLQVSHCRFLVHVFFCSGFGAFLIMQTLAALFACLLFFASNFNFSVFLLWSCFFQHRFSLDYNICTGLRDLTKHSIKLWIWHSTLPAFCHLLFHLLNHSLSSFVIDARLHLPWRRMLGAHLVSLGFKLPALYLNLFLLWWGFRDTAHWVVIFVCSCAHAAWSRFGLHWFCTQALNVYLLWWIYLIFLFCLEVQRNHFWHDLF